MATERRRAGHRWLDLIACFTLVGTALALAGASTLVRAPVGIMAVLLVPGYAAAAAVFPTDAHFDRVERLALSLGLTPAVIAVIAFLLDRFDQGLAPASIRLATAGTATLLTIVAAVRRAHSAPSNARAATAATTSPRTRAVRFVQAIVVVNLAVAALAYGLTLANRPPVPTEFYVLNKDRILADYPHDVGRGESVVVLVGVHQASDGPGSYRVEARSGETVLAVLGPVNLGPGERWESPLTFRMDTVGDDQEVVINLLSPRQQAPYRALRLWIDVHGAPPS